jgi:nucleoside 2-deoxyribosyltransferase
MEFLMYLAGPIKGLNYGESQTWRTQVRDEVNEVAPWINTISPLRGDHPGKTDPSLVVGGSVEDHILTTGRIITNRDYNDVLRSDLIFVNFLGSDEVSIGTTTEVAWAKANNKPIVMLIEKDNIHDHPFLTSTAAHLTTDISEAIHVAVSILSHDGLMEQYEKLRRYQDLN